ncbi:MAG: PqqD family protein [Pyrinomonadaceae bacterium]|nr:PqqD family protein [Pyrinomonadaceae bacterium]
MIEKNPIARKEDLVVQEVNGELLVYDLKANKASHLTETAAFIWKSCDGTRSVDDLREMATSYFKTEISRDFIVFALDELSESGLLTSKRRRHLSRREALKRIGVATMVALPIVASLSIPNTSLASATCVGITCTTTCPFPCNCSGGTCI